MPSRRAARKLASKCAERPRRGPPTITSRLTSVFSVDGGREGGTASGCAGTSFETSRSECVRRVTRSVILGAPWPGGAHSTIAAPSAPADPTRRDWASPPVPASAPSPSRATTGCAPFGGGAAARETPRLNQSGISSLRLALARAGGALAFTQSDTATAKAAPLVSHERRTLMRCGDLTVESGPMRQPIVRARLRARSVGRANLRLNRLRQHPNPLLRVEATPSHPDGRRVWP
jgi:hypothetical protein